MSTGRALRPWLVSLAVVLPGTVAMRAQEKSPRQESGRSDVVVISLRAAATVPDQRVYIEDVAQLEGGSFSIRNQIAKLDLSDLPLSEPVAPVPREQIYFRIRLAGFESARFRVEGAPVVRVNLASQQLTDKEILTAAKQAVLSHLPGTTGEITVQLAESKHPPVSIPGARERVRLEVELPSTGMPLGKVRGELVLFVRETQISRTPLNLVVTLRENVAVATRQIERGEFLTRDNVYLDQRTVADFSDYLTTIQGLTGKRAKRALTAGQVLTGQDLESAGTENPILVKQQSLVKLSAQLGPLRITAAGEALQDGRAGELIRVRNLDSKNIVIGRVVDRSLVQVDN
jgi:flagella basal body P-ring formation protein FlgA